MSFYTNILYEDILNNYLLMHPTEFMHCTLKWIFMTYLWHVIFHCKYNIKFQNIDFALLNSNGSTFEHDVEGSKHYPMRISSA